MHSRCITHRDLKPANILLLQIKPEIQVKIADFGLVSISENSKAKMTSVGYGSMGYRAPELEGRIMKSKGEIEHKIPDIYSLGMIIHYLLTRELPDLADNILQ